MKLAANLKLSVEKAIAGGVTRYAIAKGAGVPFKTLSQWLSDDRDIALSTASKIADYFGLELRPADKPAKKRK